MPSDTHHWRNHALWGLQRSKLRHAMMHSRFGRRRGGVRGCREGAEPCGSIRAALESSTSAFCSSVCRAPAHLPVSCPAGGSCGAPQASREGRLERSTRWTRAMLLTLGTICYICSLAGILTSCQVFCIPMDLDPFALSWVFLEVVLLSIPVW